MVFSENQLETIRDIANEVATKIAKETVDRATNNLRSRDTPITILATENRSTGVSIDKVSSLISSAETRMFDRIGTQVAFHLESKTGLQAMMTGHFLTLRDTADSGLKSYTKSLEDANAEQLKLSRKQFETEISSISADNKVLRKMNKRIDGLSFQKNLLWAAMVTSVGVSILIKAVDLS
jgi:hypothetical protein